MGLNDAESEGQFVWEGIDIPYSWASNDPGNAADDDFVKLKSDFAWEVRQSSDSGYFVCQSRPGIVYIFICKLCVGIIMCLTAVILSKL